MPYFFSGLPFWIVASGNIGCSVVAWYVHCGERYTSSQIRWSLRTNLLLVIVYTQLVQIGVSYQVLLELLLLLLLYYYTIIRY